MATKPKWAESSDTQRQSWAFVAPFFAVHFICNLLLLVAYGIGLTGAAIGNNACLVIEVLNSGIVGLHRSVAGPESLARICELYVPLSLLNIAVICIMASLIVSVQGWGVVATKYFLPLLIFAIVPLGTLLHAPAEFAPSSLARSMRNGSIGAYIVFVIGCPFLTAMLSVLPLQKYKRGLSK